MLRKFLEGSIVRSRSLCSSIAAKHQKNQTSVNEKLIIGQPTPKSHPHLLKPGEVMPGISLEEVKNRRQKFMNELLTVTKKHFQTNRYVAVVPSATKVIMTEKIPYTFRQNSDFLYLTGFTEPDCLMVLAATGDDVSCQQSLMFVPRRDVYTEQWEGPRTTAESAVHLLGVDDAYSNDLLQTVLNSFFIQPDVVLWCDFNSISHLPHFERILKSCVKENSVKHIESPRNLIHKLRVIKSSAEVSLMLRSCDIASEAFIKAISATRPSITEHELYTNIEHECRLRGAERLAYPPVIAGGDRATIIHYIANNQVLNESELLLMDAGCEYHGYASDITRTWPVSDRFSSAHRELYEALLDTQQKLITWCKQGLTLDQLQSEMMDLLGTNFSHVGLVPKSLCPQDKSKLAGKFCPHHVSHYLGMDVHDTPTISRSIRLQPGMVVTVEPGVYISHEEHDVPSEFRGVGMRIEDNILITEEEPLVLSAKCPKTVREIESLKTRASA